MFLGFIFWCLGFPSDSGVKNLPVSQETQAGDEGLIPGLGRSPEEEKQLSTPVFLPGRAPEQRSLVDYSLWHRKRVGHN